MDYNRKLDPTKATTRICTTCNARLPGETTMCPHDGTVIATSDQDRRIGTTLAERYEILSLLGSGGMGDVYLAQHLLMERLVAIKILRAHLLSEPQYLKRFQQEAKAASCLSHPHVVTIYDFGISPQGLPFLVMDYIQGASLADVIKRDVPLGLGRSLSILSQTCEALAHAHHKGIIHRDVKPSNIMLTQTEEENDYVKVVDFGIAKLLPKSGKEVLELTRTGECFGSPLYMSPEQWTGKKLSASSDIYSFGCVMYETLIGQPPFLGNNVFDTMSKHLTEVPLHFASVCSDICIPEHLEMLVFKALEKEPEQRYRSLKQLKTDLEAISQNLASGETKNIARLRAQAAFGTMLSGRRRIVKRKAFSTVRRWIFVFASVLLGSGVLFIGFLVTASIIESNSKKETVANLDDGSTFRQKTPAVSNESIVHDQVVPKTIGNMSIYQDKIMGISFLYPKGWVVKDNPDKDHQVKILNAANGDLPEIALGIPVPATSPWDSAKRHGQYVEANIFKRLKNCVLLERKEIKFGRGSFLKGYRQIIRLKYGYVPLKGLLVWFERGRQVNCFFFTTHELEFDQFLPTCKIILESVKPLGHGRMASDS